MKDLYIRPDCNRGSVFHPRNPGLKPGWAPFSDKKTVFILLLVALSLRVIVLFTFDSISKPQVWEYEEIANNILKGKGLYFTLLDTKYQNTAMVLYPLTCAGIYYVTKHSFLAVKTFQILISLLSCLIIYKLSKRIFGYITGIIALALISIHPGLIVYSVKLHPLTLDILLFTLSIYCFFLIFNNQRVIRNSFLTGLCIGITLLTRATIGLFLPVMIMILGYRFWSQKYKLLKIIITLGAGVFLIVSLFVARNYIIFNRVVLLPNDSGSNFWTGNNPNSLGTANTLDGKSVMYSMPRDLSEKLKVSDEFGQNKLFYQEAENFIKNNPIGSLALFGKKLYYYWWFSPNQGLNYLRSWLIMYKVYYTVILLFAISGFFAAFKKIEPQRRYILYTLLLFFITISIAQSLYYVEGRHRWAIEPMLLIFTANGIVSIKNMVKR